MIGGAWHPIRERDDDGIEWVVDVQLSSDPVIPGRVILRAEIPASAPMGAGMRLSMIRLTPGGSRRLREALEQAERFT